MASGITCRATMPPDGADMPKTYQKPAICMVLNLQTVGSQICNLQSSGVIYDAKRGLVLTSAHVVAGLSPRVGGAILSRSELNATGSRPEGR